MSDVKKRRLSMLDNLAAAGASAPQTSMMSTNRALRSARDAVDNHHVWDLDPASIDDTRIADRLEPESVAELREAIETNGQAVPILVRRNPKNPDRYLLVYGRRRLEAVRWSDKVPKIRALVANLDDDAAIRTQISENMARQDLSYIEKAIFAKQLVAEGFGNQSQVADVLTVTKSSISMAISVAQTVGPDLARAIGPAYGVGRPRWEMLAKAIDEQAPDLDWLVKIADDIHTAENVARVRGEAVDDDSSRRAFEAVLKALSDRPAPPRRKSPPAKPLQVAGQKTGSIKRTDKGLIINLENGGFSDWVEANMPDLINDLHARWTARDED